MLLDPAHVLLLPPGARAYDLSEAPSLPLQRGALLKVALGRES